jgi:hypothetical protein
VLVCNHILTKLSFIVCWEDIFDLVELVNLIAVSKCSSDALRLLLLLRRKRRRRRVREPKWIHVLLLLISNRVISQVLIRPVILRLLEVLCVGLSAVTRNINLMSL